MEGTCAWLSSAPKKTSSLEDLVKEARFDVCLSVHQLEFIQSMSKYRVYENDVQQQYLTEA
jgi:hypothetical protein